MISASQPPLIVDVYNTANAARQLGMRRAMLINQTGRYENLIVCADGPLVAELRAKNIRVFTTPIPRKIAPLEMLRCAREIARLIGPYKCSVIHSHGSTAAVCARLAARKARVPYAIHTVHGFHFHSGMPRWRQRIYAAAEKMLTRYTDLLLFQNQEDLNESLQFGIKAPLGNLKVGNGIDLSTFGAPSTEPKADPPIVAVIGRFEPVKNQAMMLRVARILADRGLKFEIWFAGAGPGLEQHRQMAAQMGLSEQTKFLGFCSDVGALVRRASIAALSSVKEGIPRALMEPMAAGIPVVATNVKGNRETVVHGETGFLVPLNDDLAFADALQKLLGDPALRERMGSAASQWVRQSFDENLVVERLLDVYDSLLACDRQAAKALT